MKLTFATELALVFCLAGCGLAIEGSAERPAMAFERTEDFTPVTLGARPRAAERPLFFAEFLGKYGMFQNYLHYWIDRPLYWDRAMRPERMEYETAASFAVHAEQLSKYQLDGLDVFARAKTTDGRDNLAKFDEWFVQSGHPELHILPIIGYGEAVNRTGPDPAAFKTAISAAQANPRAPRFGGKVLVPTYNYRMFTAEQHRKFLADLTQALGNDDFILCGQPNISTMRKLQGAYRRNGRLTSSEKSELEQMLREVLEVAGGIQLSPLEQIREPEGPYCTHYSTEFFDKELAPLALKLLNEPQYRNKALGFYIHQGYINNHSGHNHAEDGTSTLRRCLRSALKLNPDYLLLFEWNELNENTMFQPTVWNGQSVSRIIRWHSRLMKGLGPDVYPGDDTSIPDLTLSYRATVKVGEVLDFEILNVPDGVRKGTLPVQLRLSNCEGRLVQTFPAEKIDETKFGAITYRASTAGFRGGDELRVTLVADGKTYDAFHPIRISPTVSWNYKAVRHSLRDQLKAKKGEVEVRKVADGKYAYSVDIAFDEPLASVELMVNENEQAAAGLQSEYDRTNFELLRLCFTAPPKEGVRDGLIRIETKGSTRCRFHNVWTANVDPGVIRPLKDGAGFTTGALIWGEGPSFLIEVPKDEADQVELAISVNSKKTPCVPVTIPVKSALKFGIAAAELNEAGVRVDALRQENLADLPPHLKTTTCTWDGETETSVHAPVFHVRAVSESGRIWRSAPVRAEPLSTELSTYAVYDEFRHRPTTAEAPSDLMPEIRYLFNPQSGAALGNTWERCYDATLGGGFQSDKTFSSLAIAPPSGRRAPAWVKEDGAWCLRFDGVNDYISFPREAFPQAAFTLAFVIKPELAGVRQMTLFRHFDSVRGSLSLFVRDGQLFATWGDKNLSREPKFETGLEVKDGEWNKISVRYDFNEFVFRVNGVEKRMPWQGRAWSFKPSVFGGHNKAELSGSSEKPVYFKGLLRNLAIRHW